LTYLPLSGTLNIKRIYKPNGGMIVPTYTFECSNCGRFDMALKMSSPTLSECPTCKGSVKKIFLPQRAIFKGGLPSNSYERNFSFLDMNKLASGKVNHQEAMQEYKAKRWGENASDEQIIGDFQRTLDTEDIKVKNLDSV
jgi:putative FmdB family regulatory protein